MANTASADEFLEKEKRKVSGIMRFFGIEPELATTFSLCEEKKLSIRHETVSITPSWLNRLVVLPFILLNIFPIVILLRIMTKNEMSGLIFPAMIIFLLLILFLILYFTLLDKKRNYKIIISKEGIRISQDNFRWEDIRETYIMSMPKTKTRSSYFVIQSNTDEFRKFSLFNFTESDEKFSALIEFFKQKNKN